MRAYQMIAGSNSLAGLHRCERPGSRAQATQILVRIKAASLNYRDLMIARGHYMGGTGSRQHDSALGRRRRSHRGGLRGHAFRVGDRVAAHSFAAGSTASRRDGPLVALGAPPADGVLAEYAVFDEQDAVAVPAHLSAEAAATLPCAAVTAWHALMDNGRVVPGDTVLLIGTGGVSIFALQFARLAGARVLITLLQRCQTRARAQARRRRLHQLPHALLSGKAKCCG